MPNFPSVVMVAIVRGSETGRVVWLPRTWRESNLGDLGGEDRVGEAGALKSNKQRRAELKARREKKAEAKRKAARRKVNLPAIARGVDVDRSQLAPDRSCGEPDFVTRGYYVDIPFDCQACGVAEIWTGQQQKWWYEVAKGKVWTTARLCRSCRHAERARRDEARRVHLEGLARKLGQVDAEPQPE